VARQRDYKAEYQRRIARGVARNLTRSQARGHPGVREAYASGRSRAPLEKADAAIQKAIAAMRSGKSLAATAKAHKVSRERLSAFAKSSADATFSGKRWTFNGDSDRLHVPIIAKGHPNSVNIWVRGERSARLAGEHYEEAGRAIEKPSLFPMFEKRWSGVTITDLKGREFEFETDPNAVYRAMHADEVDWSRIYQRLTN
jgi:hypothetical protein